MDQNLKYADYNATGVLKATLASCIAKLNQLVWYQHELIKNFSKKIAEGGSEVDVKVLAEELAGGLTHFEIRKGELASTKIPVTNVAARLGHSSHEEPQEQEQRGDETVRNSRPVGRLDGNIPIFSGSNPKDDLTSWLFLVNNSFELSNTPDDKKISSISTFLRGLALQTLISFRTERPDGSWGEFVALMKKNFISPNRDRNLRIQLRNLRQKDSFDAFLNEFLFLLNQISRMNEEDKILHFTEGLKAKT